MRVVFDTKLRLQVRSMVKADPAALRHVSLCVRPLHAVHFLQSLVLMFVLITVHVRVGDKQAHAAHGRGAIINAAPPSQLVTRLLLLLGRWWRSMVVESTNITKTFLGAASTAHTPTLLCEIV